MQLNCKSAVRLHRVTSTVKRSRIERTEARVLDAAARLFVRDGYAATTLRAVAETADVAERTVYLRFGTKAALFRRVLDVAIVGDAAPVDVLHRDWMQAAITAPTLAERIAAAAAAGRQIMERTGDLFAVAQQAAAIEPTLAAAMQDGRDATRDNFRVVAAAMRKDRLLPRTVDVERLADTCGVICAAETYLLWRRITRADLDAYQAWLRDTLGRLTAGP